MDIAQKKTFKSRLDSLKRENRKLSEKQAALKKEKQLLQRDLKVAHKLLTEIPGPVILVQSEHIIFANESAWKLLGYSEEELLGQTMLSLVHSRSADFARIFNHKLSSGKPLPDQFEVYMRKKNGEPLCCEVRWKKIRYHRRIAFLYNVTGLDMRKKEEKKFIKTEKIKAIARMSAWLSRDYDNGLKIISEQLSRLKGIESVADKALIRALRGFEARLEMGNNISRKLNCLIRPENDPLDVSIFDIKKIIQDAVGITRPQWKDNGYAQIKVRTYLRALSPVEGHCNEIRDAFVCMILNAIDAMPEGGEIYLTTEEDSEVASIYIQDNGTGISDEIRDKIFDPFFSTRGRGHAGLGLSMAQTIINRNGGRIEVTSQEGQGATFLVKIPLYRRRHSGSGNRHLKNRIRESSILIIWAGSIAEDLLIQVLAKKGGKVTVVYSVMEALKLLRRKSFDIVVMGIDDPDFDPAGAVQKVRRIKKGMPIVLANAGDNSRPFRKLKEAGADLIIERPLDMDRILSLISDIIASRAGRA